MLKKIFGSCWTETSFFFLTGRDSMVSPEMEIYYVRLASNIHL